MATNIGTLDRALRIGLGLLLLVLTMAGNIGLWGLVGLVPLFTGLFSVCPLYSMLGWSTCARKTP